MDFNDYQSQIKELLLMRKSPDFNVLFNKILVNESSSDKFLVKMEISRLSTPCQRIIDLRGKSVFKCKLFVYEKIEHYLDKSSKVIFENSIQLYGQYTIGVFENVIAHNLKTKKEQQQNKGSTSASSLNTNLQCELITLSEKNQRAAPRMFYVSDIELELENGKKLSAQTTNISISGLKVKLKEAISISNKESIKISFSSFNAEFVETKGLLGARYQLVGQDTIDNTQYFFLSYIENNINLVTFIQEFIRVNQYKYKIDVYYYYQLAKNKLLTNYYLANTNKLPVCLNIHSSTPFLFTLENNQNKESIAYWQLQKTNKLNEFFNELRVPRLIKESQTNFETIVYSFTHKENDIKHYFAATEEELIEKKLKNLFIHYGHNKNSWRIYSLSITPYSYKQHAIHPDIAKKYYALLNKITHVATLEDISKTPHLPYKINEEENEFNKLNQFLLYDKTNQHQEQNIFQVFPIELRQEDRYLYKSNSVLYFKGNQYPVQILNFSLSGLMVKLKKSLNITTKTELQLDLTDLQKVSKKLSLSGLNYTVINYDSRNILNLQVADTKTKQIAKNFFSLLIQYNSAHFKKMPTRYDQLAFSDELKKISEENQSGCAFFVARENHHADIKYASINTPNTALKTLFGLLSDNNRELNVTPLTNNFLYKRLISKPLQTKSKNSVLKETIIYIKTQQNRRGEWKIKSYLDEDFKSSNERNDFIKYSAESSEIYILHYRLTSLDLPDFNIIQHEMHAISRFALHLTKKLKEELLAMNGLIEITDCTPFFKKYLCKTD